MNIPAVPEELAYAAIVLSSITAIFWLVASWRAVKTHERAAVPVRVVARRSRNGSSRR